jgi:hypothetical protein
MPNILNGCKLTNINRKMNPSIVLQSASGNSPRVTTDYKANGFNLWINIKQYSVDVSARQLAI